MKATITMLVTEYEDSIKKASSEFYRKGVIDTVNKYQNVSKRIIGLSNNVVGDGGGGVSGEDCGPQEFKKQG